MDGRRESETKIQNLWMSFHTPVNNQQQRISCRKFTKSINSFWTFCDEYPLRYIGHNSVSF